MADNDYRGRDERNWRGSPYGERDVRQLGRHRDFGRDMLNDMRRYARGGYEGGFGEGGYESGSRGPSDSDRREDWRQDYARQTYGEDRSRSRDDRGFLARAGDEMASWVGDEDAERRRRMDALRGDRGARHHRGVGPRGYRRSDERIREDVCERLTDDPYVDATDVEIAVGNGEITLSGTVDSRAARRRAEDLAESVSGVTHVQNNLRVGASGMAQGGGPSWDSARTTGTVGRMDAPATVQTADTDSVTRR